MTEPPTIYVICPDQPIPIGGIRKLYRHVDVLNANGLNASIVHQAPGFRCTWFENQTKICHFAGCRLRANDVMVCPEVLATQLAEQGYPMKIVVLNQNAYYTFRSYSFDAADRNSPYLDDNIAAVLVVSDDNREYLAYAFGHLKLHRIIYSIDPHLFRYDPAIPKRPQICFMPRKRADEAVQLINLLKFHGALDGFNLVAIDKQSETQVACTLRESLMFLSFGYPEGCPLPPLEAMASGCLTIGYHGMGGREYFREELAYPIHVGDLVGYAKTVERILNQWRTDPAPLRERAARASAFIHEHYSEQREAESILGAWRSILGERDP